VTTVAEARSVGARIARRLVYVHTIDVLGCSTAVPPPAVRRAPELVLHRVKNIDGVLRDVPAQSSFPPMRMLRSMRRVDARLRARSTGRRAQRFAKGEIAYVATAGPDVAAWLWLSASRSFQCHWSGLHFSLQPDEAYIYDLWSYPAYRDAGAGSFVMRGLLEDLHRQGDVARVYGYIMRENRPNQVLTRVVFGFEQVQQVKDIRVLGRRGWQLPFTAKPRTGPCSRVPRAPAR
jgi:ribosomal protein S18 acetylase RimI-like enzyme